MTMQWPNGKGQKDKQRSRKHYTQKTKDWSSLLRVVYELSRHWEIKHENYWLPAITICLTQINIKLLILIQSY